MAEEGSGVSQQQHRPASGSCSSSSMDTSSSSQDNSESVRIATPAATRAPAPAPFLVKTYEIVDDEETDSTVSWSPSGKSFVIWNPQHFCQYQLPRYLKHCNFSSFIRQLNIYGFRKIDPDRWEFANACFLRGNRHLLQGIRRRTSASTGSGSRQHAGSSSSREPYRRETESACLSAIPPIEAMPICVGRLEAATGSGSDVWAPTVADTQKDRMQGEIDRLRMEKGALMMEVMRLRNQLRNTEQELQQIWQTLQVMERQEHHMLVFASQAAGRGFVRCSMGQEQQHPQHHQIGAQLHHEALPLQLLPGSSSPGGNEASGSETLPFVRDDAANPESSRYSSLIGCAGRVPIVPHELPGGEENIASSSTQKEEDEVNNGKDGKRMKIVLHHLPEVSPGVHSLGCAGKSSTELNIRSCMAVGSRVEHVNQVFDATNKRTRMHVARQSHHDQVKLESYSDVQERIPHQVGVRGIREDDAMGCSQIEEAGTCGDPMLKEVTDRDQKCAVDSQVHSDCLGNQERAYLLARFTEPLSRNEETTVDPLLSSCSAAESHGGPADGLAIASYHSTRFAGEDRPKQSRFAGEAADDEHCAATSIMTDPELHIRTCNGEAMDRNGDESNDVDDSMFWGLLLDYQPVQWNLASSLLR